MYNKICAGKYFSVDFPRRVHIYYQHLRKERGLTIACTPIIFDYVHLQGRGGVENFYFFFEYVLNEWSPKNNCVLSLQCEWPSICFSSIENQHPVSDIYQLSMYHIRINEFRVTKISSVFSSIRILASSFKLRLHFFLRFSVQIVNWTSGHSGCTRFTHRLPL